MNQHDLKAIANINNGNIPRWKASLLQISKLPKGSISIEDSYLKINTVASVAELQPFLKEFIPWRKGPFLIGDIKLESEWLGYTKWQRLQSHITPLHNRKVLDVGASNGYFSYLFSLLGAKSVVAIEPFLLFYFQFLAIKYLTAQNLPIEFITNRFENLDLTNSFDSVFSMGVLYHQKSPIEHLLKLKATLVAGGELILETLIVDGNLGYSLIPKERYAKMRNVWFLPTVKTLELWLNKCSFKNIRCVDINQTTSKEQRATKWIGENTKSLADFLDPKDSNLTIEGLPAPKRAIFLCTK